MAAVNRNMFDAGVVAESLYRGRPSMMRLPLNLIAQIVSYLDEAGDLARVCRTCRVLNYMALPQLYRNISLTSYDRIRYREDRPEGWGSASPFSMGLNALVIRPHASLVQSMTLRGEWKELELEEHSKVGRVPDSSMMLNIVVRAVIDRSTNLESFSWELNTKMLDTVYTGLVQLPKLTSLSIRFPSSRHPRPIFVIPAMPHLLALKVTDIDPLCHPDDISTLLAKSRNLRDLTMHWSPRMRELQEPSVVFHDYFRKVLSRKSPLKLRKIAFHNLYARNSIDATKAIDQGTIEEITFLSNCSPEDATYSTFIDKSWMMSRPPPTHQGHIKSMRHDSVSRGHCEFLASISSLEKIYFVNPIRFSTDQSNSPRQSTGPSSTHVTPPRSESQTGSGISNAGGGHPAHTESPSSPPSPTNNFSQFTQLRDTFLNPILSNNGATLRHLLLPSRWPLPTSMIARMVHTCPNLEQLALAPDISALDTLRLLMPFLRKLVAVHILIPPSDKSLNGQSVPIINGDNGYFSISTLSEIVELDDSLHLEKISATLADQEVHSRLKMVGIGWKAWELGKFYAVPVSDCASSGTARTGDTSAEETTPENRLPIDVNESANHMGTVNHNPSGSRQLPSLRSLSAPAAALGIKSSLGKRRREGSSPGTPVFDLPNGTTNCEDGDNVIEILPSGEKVVWRRQARRVGWDVLKHWAIWAMDTQDV